MRRFITRKKTPQAERGHTPIDAALRFLATRERTVREVERYLDEQQYGEIEVQQVVDRLQELGYLNDAAYAAEFIKTRLNTKPISRGKLQEQLLAHELPREVVTDALRAVSDEMERQNVLRVARKHAAQLQAYALDEREQRLLRRLVSRGFSYEDSKLAIESLFPKDD